MASYQVRVNADTKAATKSLKNLDKQVDAVTKTRQLSFNFPNYGQFTKNVKSVQTAAKGAAEDVKTFYEVARNAPVSGQKLRAIEDAVDAVGEAASNTTEFIRENNSATKAMGNAASAAGGKVGELINQFAKFSVILYGVNEVTNILTSTFRGFFNETIGRAAKFEQTLLKTQTTLASTNRVFIGGDEITDPLEKINALTGEIGDRVESIRQRSIDLAGVTSNDVVEVFGMVASQISQINGDLGDAEDLAIQFAAALGTFGIPLYQARQEIGSILRGDITIDSYLAKALGITNEDIARAKREVGGVVGFLNTKLAAAVAGQEIAAKGLYGVLSNIRDIYELIGQSIGEPLLQPIIDATTQLYNILFKSKDLLMELGRGLGGVLATASSAAANAFQFEGGDNPALDAITNQAPAVFQTIRQDVEGINQLIFETIQRVGDALRTLFTSVAAMTGTAIKAFRELFGALLELSLLKFESFMSAFATIAQGITPIVVGITEIVKAWADVLKMPIVQYFSQIAITFAVLKATGVIALAAIVTQLGLWALKWKLIVAKFKQGMLFIQGSLKMMFKILGSIVLLIGKALAGLRTLMASQGGDKGAIRELKKLEIELTKLGRNAKGAGEKPMLHGLFGHRLLRDKKSC